MLVERNLKITVAAVERNRPTVNAGVHHFDARGGARCQKVQHALPVIWRTEMQVGEVLISRLNAGPPPPGVARKLPDLSRCSMVDLADAGVEAANRAETRGKSDL